MGFLINLLQSGVSHPKPPQLSFQLRKGAPLTDSGQGQEVPRGGSAATCPGLSPSELTTALRLYGCHLPSPAGVKAQPRPGSSTPPCCASLHLPQSQESAVARIRDSKEVLLIVSRKKSFRKFRRHC